MEYITPDYYCANRTSVIANCYDMVNNPYWAYYETLRKLCLKIIHRDSLALSGNEEKVHGILFDGAWLWEEYLATILPKERFVHPDNKLGTFPIYLAKNIKRYPDFHTKDKKMVLDAKYKHSTTDNRNDIHQIVTYMYALQAQQGVLVYPAEKAKQALTYSDYFLYGYGGKLCQHSFDIATDNGISFDEFSKKMEQHEKEFLEQLSIVSEAE